jgi:hypothetical protein
MVSLAGRAAGAGLKYAGDLEDLPVVARPLLKRREPTVVVSGHLHLRDALAEESVLQVNCAALVEPPFEVALLNLVAESDRLEVLSEAAPVTSSSGGLRLPVLAPASEEWLFEAGAWFRTEGPQGEYNKEEVAK